MYKFADKRRNTQESKVGLHKDISRTGIPTQLKERIEGSTGVSLNYVRVNYNSDKPAKLDALAYTKGDQVEIGPGQERHLAHELGHVVQQKLGAVRTNARHASGEALNTEVGLERQADEIGAGKKVELVQRMRDQIVQRQGTHGNGQQQTNRQMSPQEAQQYVVAQIQAGQVPSLNGQQIVGLYGNVRGHHPHSQAAFRGNTGYDPDLAVSISESGLNQMGIDHENITRAQAIMYRTLGAGTSAPNHQNIPLSVISSVENRAMRSAGMNPIIADYLTNMSAINLSAQGVAPNRIPYTKK